MGLVKRNDGPPVVDAAVSVVDEPASLAELLRQLEDVDADVRRRGVRELARYPEAVDALVGHLDGEVNDAVREAVFSSLDAIGGEAVVDALIPLLRHENAAVRNNALETMQGLAEPTLARMDAMLQDPEPHVRIFAINILAGLEGVDVAWRLLQALEVEEHVNVVATALDHLVEMGTEEMIPSLQGLRKRWEGEQFICFVIDTAINRMRGE